MLVFVPDPDLRYALLRTGGFADHLITARQMKRIKDLWIPGKRISDLTGLEFAVNLEELYLDQNPVADLAPLANLTRLRRLELDDTSVVDLTPLAGLSGLVDLSMNNTRVSDLEPLAGLAGLRFLQLRDTDVSDLAPLAPLLNIERLRLSGTKVSDLAPLSGLKRLSRVSLDGTAVRRLDPLAEMADLVELHVDRTPVSDLTPLSRMSRLERLTLANARVSDLGPIADLGNLTHVDASNARPLRRSHCYDEGLPPESFSYANAVSELPPLGGLRQLRELRVDHNRITTLRALEGLTDLRTLTASGNRISELTGLEGLTRLRVLLLSDNRISDLAPLADLTDVEVLSLDGNAISGLGPLEHLGGLVDLHLDDNAISHVTALAGLAELVVLDLGHNAISDIQPLASLPRLRTLYLEENAIVNLLPFVEWFRKTRSPPPRTDLRGNPLDAESLAIAERWGSFVLPVDSHGDLPRSASSLDIGGTLGGRIDPRDEVDYFRFAVDEPVTLDITTVTSESDNETWQHRDFVHSRGALLTDSGRVLAHGRHITRRLPPGRYRVGVSSGCLTIYWDYSDEFADVFELRPRTHYTIGIREVSEVNVPDANLRARLRAAIEAQRGPSVDAVTTSDMLRLESVRASDANIVDLTGIEAARFAETLEFGGNAITDLLPLQGLGASVTTLSLARNSVFDIAPLARFRRLRNLDLSGNVLSDIAPLAELAGLAMLDLSDNAITELSPLEGLPDLDYVDLSGNRIRRVSSIRANHLDLAGNRIGDLSTVADRASSLNLSGNSVSDLSSLVGDPAHQYQRLLLTENAITDIEPLLRLNWVPFLPTPPYVDLRGNPMSHTARTVHVPMLREKGVFVIDGEDHADSREHATALAPGETARGRVHYRDVDYYRFAMPKAGHVQVSVNAFGVPWSLETESGTTVAERPFRRRLEAGVYYLRVETPSLDVKDYIIRVDVLSAPGNVRAELAGSEARVGWDLPHDVPVPFGTPRGVYVAVATSADGGAQRSCWAPLGQRGCVIRGLSEHTQYEVAVGQMHPSGAEDGPRSQPLSIFVDGPRSFLRGWRQLLVRPEGETR